MDTNSRRSRIAADIARRLVLVAEILAQKTEEQEHEPDLPPVDRIELARKVFRAIEEQTL